MKLTEFLKQLYKRYKQRNKYNIELVVLTKKEYLLLKAAADKYYLSMAKSAYASALVKTGSIPPQPPCINEYVSDGCEKFDEAKKHHEN